MIEIDGKKVQAEPGSMIIEAADKVGVKIPRFCYHKKLSIAANCRMCLVDVANSRKPLPACATPITEGMVVHTQTQAALQAQKAVMEFLLINHPLDCPICDQGGECELQDLAMGYGKDISRFSEGKRVVKDKNLGSLISTDMTRCILCTRCVRFGEEVAGMVEMGVTGRGETSEVGTYIEEHLISEVSGNIIDLCPVGALTSKPFRFKARAWELTQHPSISAHDALGAHIYLHTRRDEVMRVVPRENEALNETWASDRDRFSYAGLASEDRLLEPMIKKNGHWQTCDWAEALAFAHEALHKIQHEKGAEQIAALVSPQVSIEEHYLFQKYIRALGSDKIDHRLRYVDPLMGRDLNLSDPLAAKIAEVESMDAVFILGCDPQREMPLLGLRLRKAALQGAAIVSLNPIDFNFTFEQQQTCIVEAQEMLHALVWMMKHSLKSGEENIWPLLKESADVPALVQAKMSMIAAVLQKEGQKLMIMGALASQAPQAHLIQECLHWLCERWGAKLMILSPGANSTGACIAGSLPKDKNISSLDFWKAKLSAYVLLGVEPEFDCTHPHWALEALHQAESVIVLSAFKTPKMLEYADVLLPIAAFSEYAGSFVNFEGSWQTFKAAVNPKGQARPAWKVLRVLGNLGHYPGFEYENWEQVSLEIKEQAKDQNSSKVSSALNDRLADLQTGLKVLPYWPMYRADPLVRRSAPLQACALTEEACVLLNPKTAQTHGLKAGDTIFCEQEGSRTQLILNLDPRVPEKTLYWPMGFEETQGLASAISPVQIAGHKG